MMRNRKLNVACEYLHTRIKQVLPYVYSAVALAMWDVLDETDDEKYEDIATLIQKSYEIWIQCEEEGRDILKWCEEVTGHDIKHGIG